MRYLERVRGQKAPFRPESLEFAKNQVIYELQQTAVVVHEWDWPPHDDGYVPRQRIMESNGFYYACNRLDPMNPKLQIVSTVLTKDMYFNFAPKRPAKRIDRE